jgi:large subunit ribosomal protein L13
VSTYTPKKGDIQRAWHVVDADGLILGRLASEVAKILRGKHKPIFTPHQDTGDHVVIVNADKVVLSGSKKTEKAVYSHSGYPGGLKTKMYGDLLTDRPEEALRKTIGGMLPKNSLGRQMLTKLKIYRGESHPHDAQKPQQLELEHTRLRGPKEIKPIEAQTTEVKVSDSQEESVDTSNSDGEERKTSEGASLQDLGLTDVIINNLAAGGIETIEELVSKTNEDILGIPKIGPKAVEQIINALKDNGFTLKEI